MEQRRGSGLRYVGIKVSASGPAYTLIQSSEQHFCVSVRQVTAYMSSRRLSMRYVHAIMREAWWNIHSFQQHLNGDNLIINMISIAGAYADC